MIKIKENNDKIKEKIVEYLKTSKIGAPSTEISKNIGHNRITVSKYLEILKAEGSVSFTDMAQAKLWKLKDIKEKPSILIVDDEPHVVNLVKLSLDRDKYKLFEAFSGKDALSIIAKEKIDLVILDLMMPEMSGYEVCKQIKENALTSNIHVIILTAKGEIPDKVQGIEKGADDYMVKPFDPMELEARINLIMENDQDGEELHPLTKLPAKKKIKTHLKNMEGRCNVYNFKINKLEKYAESHGYKKLNNLVVLFTRLIGNSLLNEKGGFLGHTINNNFVVVSKSDKLDEDITKSFEKMLPYVYDSGNPKDAVNLNIKKMSINENKEHEQILKKLMIE